MLETKAHHRKNYFVISSDQTRLNVTDLLLFLMTIIWGANYTAIKYSLEYLAPLSFNALRFVLASGFMIFITFISGNDLKIKRGDFWQLFRLGVLVNVVYQVLFIIGFTNTRIGNATLIISTAPVFTAIIGRIRKQESLNRQGIVGLLLTLSGILLVILCSSDKLIFKEVFWGDCLLLIATICWAFYTIEAKRYVDMYGSIKTTTIMMIIGTPILLLTCLPSLTQQDLSNVGTVAWAGLIYSAFLAIALAHLIWNYGVRKVGSTRTAIYSNITPVTGIVVAWLVLSEQPTIGQLAGGVIIFAGVYLVRHGVTAYRTKQNLTPAK